MATRSELKEVQFLNVSNGDTRKVTEGMTNLFLFLSANNQRTELLNITAISVTTFASTTARGLVGSFNVVVNTYSFQSSKSFFCLLKVDVKNQWDGLSLGDTVAMSLY